VFAFLGLGLAFPFVLVAFTPVLARRLPKPGAWMEGFRHLLAFPVYGTAAWLAWVFASQTGTLALPFLFAAALTVAFGAWLWGVEQRREAQTGSPRWLPRLLAGVFVLLAVPAVLQGSGAAPAEAAPAAGAAQAAASAPAGTLPSEPWSAARVAELQAQGRPVFVDFTAAWCVTCQVNERTALTGKAVLDAFAAKNAVYLKADWTRRDPVIAQALTAQGRSGVPLYLVYSPGKPDPAVLPQLLTEGLVVEAIEAAAKPA
jgi:thiol:disulfide interchange protein DsbD